MKLLQASLLSIFFSAVLLSQYAMYNKIEDLNNRINKLLHIQSLSAPDDIADVEYRTFSREPDLEAIVARAVSRVIDESMHNQKSYPAVTNKSAVDDTYEKTSRFESDAELIEVEARIANTIARGEATPTELREMLSGMAHLSHEKRNVAAKALTQAINTQQITVHNPYYGEHQ